MNEEVRHFSLRKLSVGLASVLVGVSIFGASQTVKADTVADQTASAVTGSVQSKDTQENKNATESSFSNDNQVANAKSNMAQTQENGSKQVQAENVQQDSVPKTQEATDGSDLDAEKSATRAGSLQEPDNQLNTVTGKTAQHNTLESGQKTQSFNLPKNSKKFARKVLATNLIATPPTTNGGFDEATWGKLDVNDWQGSVKDGVYQLTHYSGDLSHIIVPNEADFEKAGKSTNGLQVGITRDTINSIFSETDSIFLETDQEQSTIAFSKTNNKKVKAIGTDWSNAFSVSGDKVRLSKFDGSNLDVSNVTNMRRMFTDTSIGDFTSLANWDTSNVTNMSYMFTDTSISNLTPLANWDTSSVTTMKGMFGSMFSNDNSISDLTPLANWDTSKVTDMSEMFTQNSISNLTGLANWDTSKVTDMREMFAYNSISNLTGLAKWDTSNVTDMNWMFAHNSISNLTGLANWNVSKVVNMGRMFANNKISDLTPLTNWKTSSVTDMSGMFGNSKYKFMPDGSSVLIDGNSISDLAPLTNWDVGNVTDMSSMFEGNKISNLTSLTNWKTSKVTSMSGMFSNNQISNLSPLASWNTGKVISMSGMFANNPDLIDLKPIANWNISDINDYYGRGFSGLFRGDTKLDLTNINNTPLMQSFLKKPIMLQGSTFIINNVDFVARLVKATTGKDLPTLTNTAKRTIVFHFPDGTSNTITQTIYYRAIAPVQVNWPDPPAEIEALFSRGMGTLVPYDPNNPNRGMGTLVPYDPNNPHHVTPHRDNPYSPKIIKTYPVKDPDWQLDTSQTNDAIIVNGQIRFKPVKIPHINGYKAHLVRNPFNPAMFMVSFMAVPTENKPSTPVEVTPSKPSAPVDNPSKPSAPVDNTNKYANNLQKHVAAKLNSNDLGWTMPVDISNSTYTVKVPVDNTIDLSDLVIAEPVHAQTRTQIHVTKRFKLSKKHSSKKHSIKHLKHRKRVSKLFSKRYASL